MMGLLACAAAPVRAQGVPLVFAAASLKTALDEIAKRSPMRISYGGSGVLARQITQGAPADIYISASPDWMTHVAQAERLEAGSKPLLTNRLVLIGPPGEPRIHPKDISEHQGRIATGLVRAVPVGQYAKAALESLGLWGKLRSQIVQTDNARAALALVARGELPFGIVYESDAMAENRVSVLYKFDVSDHPKIIYQAGVIKGSGATLSGLTSADARASFARYGFEPL